MFSVRTDQKKNRIYVTLGDIGTNEGTKIYNALALKLKELKPGFSGVSDISAFKIADPNEGRWAKKIFDLLLAAKIGNSARVTGLKGEIKQETGEHGQPVFIVETLEQADKVLDGL